MRFNTKTRKQIFKRSYINSRISAYLRTRFNAYIKQIQISLFLSLRYPLICKVNYVCGRFSALFYQNSFFGVGLPAYFSSHSLFLREHIFVGLNEFPSLKSWCTIIHHHQPQGPTLFLRVRWDFMCVQ